MRGASNDLTVPILAADLGGPLRTPSSHRNGL